MKTLNIIALALVIVGGLNWLLVGAFHMDLVSTLFGVDTIVTRIVYCLVGVAAIYCLSFFRNLTINPTRVEYTRTANTTSI